MLQLTNTPEPGEFRIGRVGREYQDQCEIKLDGVDEVSYDDIKLGHNGSWYLIPEAHNVFMFYL